MSRKKFELKQWAKENMKGVENTLLPSFTPDMKGLDEEGIRLDVRQSIKHGFFSMMCATEAGLTLAEAKQFLSIAADEAGGAIIVTTSLILDSLEDNMELMLHAEQVGVDGILLGYPPQFHPHTATEIYEVTRQFCEATNMHITLYPSPHFHFNRFHNSGFPLEIVEGLAEIDNVVAIKVGELGLYADLHRLVGDKVLLGCPVERYAPLLVQGFGMQWMGAGCYEVFQSPGKRYLVDYFNLLLSGKTAEAMDIYWKLAPARITFEQQFNQTVMTGTYNWQQQKYYQWCVGGNGGLTRQPAMKVHTWEMEMTKMAFRMIDIEPNENDDEFIMGRTNYCRRNAVADNALSVDVSGLVLTDAGDREVALSAFAGEVLVLYGGGQGAAEEGKKWGQSLASIEEVTAIEVVFVGELPSFVPKKLVKKNVVNNAVNQPVFDWSGTVARMLGVTNPNSPHLFVIDRSGRLRFKLVGPYSVENMAQVKAEITQNV
ncbi:MAG: dihydrodipicolinate synthase family protein [Anaerolineae bacterium]|nr:dihydrodipicolinate synthase family protein [Anaerolineae bacterium]